MRTPGLPAGSVHEVDAEALDEALRGAWLDFGGVVLVGDHLRLSGEREGASDIEGRRHQGRYRWDLEVEGVERVEVADPRGAGGLTIAAVRAVGDRLQFSADPDGHLVVHGCAVLRVRISPHRLPPARHGHEAQGSVPPAPAPRVIHTESIVRQCLERHGGEAAADVRLGWSPRAGIWQIDVVPRTRAAAPVSVGVVGEELLVRLPNSRWRIWRSLRGPDPLAVLDEQLDAVMAGRVQEAGTRRHRAVRLYLASGMVNRTGSTHLPVPWRMRRRTRYAPYGPPDDPAAA